MLLRRICLAVIVVDSLLVGLWAQFFPRSFYDDFPGFGRAWVAGDGPFNDHLVRDVGGLNLAVGLVAIAALVTRSVTITRVAGGAALVYGLPHLVYHLHHLSDMETVDVVGNVLALGTAVIVALIALWPPRAADD